MNLLETKMLAFSMIDGNEAYVVHAKKGTLLTSDNKPILFTAGEKDKYKFMLRCAFVFGSNKVNLLVMSCNKMVTPKFFVTLRCFSGGTKSIFESELLLCAHGTRVVADQHFFAEIEVPERVASAAKKLSLRINIGGTSVPFHIWSPDMKSITVANSNSELVLPWKSR